MSQTNFFSERNINEFKAIYINTIELVTLSELYSRFNDYQIIRDIVSNTCKNIGKEYIRLLINNIENPDTHSKYDIVFHLKKNIDSDFSTSQNPAQLIKDTVTGIMIVELGECQKYPDYHTLNLICTTQQGVGNIFIPLYLFCIMMRLEDGISTQKTGLLELAGGYQNLIGLCLYSKYNFQYDVKLYSDDENGELCFSSGYNLPMGCNVETYGTGIREQSIKMINICNGTEQFKKPDICLYRNKELQQLYGVLLNAHRFSSVFYGSSKLLMLTYDVDTAFDYKGLYDRVLTKVLKKTKGNDITNDNYVDLIEKYINLVLKFKKHASLTDLLNTLQPEQLTTTQEEYDILLRIKRICAYKTKHTAGTSAEEFMTNEMKHEAEILRQQQQIEQQQQLLLFTPRETRTTVKNPSKLKIQPQRKRVNKTPSKSLSKPSKNNKLPPLPPKPSKLNVLPPVIPQDLKSSTRTRRKNKTKQVETPQQLRRSSRVSVKTSYL